jgi:hypothetical protein
VTKNETPVTKNETPRVSATPQVKVRWENANTQSVYANVCNAAGTREEIVLLFGMNQAFNVTENEMTIQLSNRIVISPFVAKRLATLLSNVVADYENKYGVLEQ